MAFSAFLSTENDLHHNLRPNIGGHTSRHNSRVPSENLNGRARGGDGDVFFSREKKGYGGANEKRLKVSKEKAERERGNASATRQRKCHNNNINSK